MESNVDAVGLQRDLMSLNDDPSERFSQGRLEEGLGVPPGATHLGIAPPSRSPSSSPSVSSSGTGEGEEDGDDDAPYGYGEDGESGGKHSRDDKLWLRLATGEESRQLLGTEEESSDRHSSGGEDDAADDEDDVSNIWAVNSEQQNYYEEQFRKLKKDPGDLLSGLEARKFFEKSGLPISDLSAIWQISDVTQDGKLDKAEFFTAMHLVVLRRHGIEVPESLPPSLHPSRILSARNSEWTKFDEDGKEKPKKKERRRPRSPPPPSCTPPPLPSLSPSLLDLECSSPPPANFDFHRSPVEQDPRIKHPKAVRVTPDMTSYPSGIGDLKVTSSVAPRVASGTDGLLLQPVPQPRQESHAPQAQQSHRIRVDASDIKGIQRPTPRKSRPGARTLGGGVPSLPPPDEIGGPASLPPTLAGAPPAAPPPPLLPHQKVSAAIQNTNPMPPPPPPRAPVRSYHTRSSSLDLNKLDRESPTTIGPTNGRGIVQLNQSQQPPAVPPRSSPAPAVKPRGHTLAGPTDGRALTALMTSSLIVTDSRPSAFREYKRPGSNEEEGAEHSPASMTRSLRVLNWEEERKEMKDRVAALLVRLPLQNDEATREEISAAVKWLQERRIAINAEIAELQSELSFLVASRQVMEQASAQNSSASES